MKLTVITWRLSKLTNDEFERIIFSESSTDKILSVLKEIYGGIFYLSTCQRIIFAYEGDNDINLFFSFFQSLVDKIPKYDIYYGEHAIQHLISVISGLESLVLGETEIQGQFRFSINKYQKYLSPTLTRIFSKIIQAGRNIRGSKYLKDGKISTIVIVEEVFREQFVNAQSIGIIGTGKMAKGVVRYLNNSYNGKIHMYTQQYARVGSLYYDISISHFNDLKHHDIIITATNQEIFNLENTKHIGKTLIIDLGVPRNCQSNIDQLEHITLVTIKDLLLHPSLENRRAIIDEINHLIDYQTKKIVEDYKIQLARDKLVSLREKILELASDRKNILVSEDRSRDFDKFINTVIYISQSAMKELIVEHEFYD